MAAAPAEKQRRPTLAELRAQLPAKCVRLFETWLQAGADLAFVAYPAQREVKFTLQTWAATSYVATARLEWTKRTSGPRLVIINKNTGAMVCASKFGQPRVLDLATVDLAHIPHDEDTHAAVQALRGQAEKA